MGIENKQAQISVHESAAIAEKLQLKSYSGRYKILMLWMPERMHIAAANKLLKLLEEPPAKTIFLLVGVDPDKILATINSRCQKVYVPKYPLSQVQGFLESEEGLDGSAANVIARLSDGNLSHARRLAERSETYRDYAELFKNWVRTCYNADVKSIVDWSQNSGRFEREKILDFLTFCSTTFRDTLHIHLGKQEEMNEIFKEINFSLKKFSPFIHLNNTPHILADIDRAAFEISRNANPKLVLMDLSLNLSRHFRSKAS
ncbi:MAG: hypothetical protein U5L96_01865 [Owenweeksia sp.]|nr:hypothetical protein [Owenweeksia sp.]